MIKSLTEETSKEQASKIYYTPQESFQLKLNKVSDPKVLKELYLLAVQKDNSRMIKLITKQAASQNISF